MLLLIDNYDSFTYNLYHAIGSFGIEIEVIRNDKKSLDDIIKSAPKAIVMSPGPGTPPESTGVCYEVVEYFADKVPILGVCLGHQVIAYAYGGEIVRAPMVVHGKMGDIIHDNSKLYKNLDKKTSMMRYHSLVVDKKTLPDCLRVTATTKDGTIMGLEHKKHNVFGVQFHPESFQSLDGEIILKNFLKIGGLLNA